MSTNEIGPQLAKLPKIHPAFFRKYRSFADDVWQKGVIPAREKEIIAVSVTTITKCSYCTQFHSKKAKKLGVTQEELIEGVTIATSLETGTALLPSLPAGVFEELGTVNQEEQLLGLFPDQSKHLHDLLIVPFTESSGTLSTKLVILISYASAHALRSNEYIRKLKVIAANHSISETELGEASLIAGALRAGSTIRHLADVLDVYDTERR
ncbi:carboxymuconolactone decarboxylase family protein [Bacillus sp. EB01]|uniref:carboxymuconolactone decarboxylase family protein n=1 Tax=Bacillus sp. EB01 TaxID=1347086 RepID=UPI0005C549DE|nr:carboxymuconolactone decarboxylase family protein [Bacillus sp. EB01]